MTSPRIPRWLEWAREIQALSQTGHHYAENEYHRHRYQRLLNIAAEITSEHTGLPVAHWESLFGTQMGYATPKVDVRGAVFHDGKLLKVRERQDGGWTMPGGWADVGDLPSQAVVREIQEESGFQVRILRLIGVYDANRVAPLAFFHAYKLVFLCEPIGGSARTSDETTAVAFFEIDDIPELLSGERTKPRHIFDAFSAYADDTLPVVFD